MRAWSDRTGHAVTVTSPPARTNERYFKYLVELGSGDASVDVFQIDVIWPGLLARHFIDLARYIDADTLAEHFPAIIANNTVDGRLVGMPWYTDVGMLFYRKDLLDRHGFRVPQRWSELADTALAIQTAERDRGQRELWGFVFQGASYEGLTCNVLEWISSHGGGELVEADGSIAVDSPAAVLALARAASWVGTIAPERVTTFSEEDARIVAQRGNAVFMRNWPYAWSLLNAPDSPVSGKFDIAPLPAGGPGGGSRGTLGGWQLAVSRYSAHPEEAADLVRYLTSEEVQRRRAIDGSYAPTIASLYADPAVLDANPFFAKLPPLLERAVARPTARTGESYMAVSTRVWEAAHSALSGNKSPRQALAELHQRLEAIRGRGW